MLELVALLTFAAMLVSSVVLGLPLLAVLVVGWLLFFDYGLLRGFDMRELAAMSTRGLARVAPVLSLFALIGALTAAWRAAGTLPAITCWSVHVVGPSTLVPSSFLLCGLMSLLTGSSFAASATTGVICMTVANSMGVDLLPVGGAVLSGSFLGDQLSPLSSSAALVAGITGTDVLDNVKRMIGTSLVPFVGSLLLYTHCGNHLSAAGVSLAPTVVGEVSRAFASFDLAPVVLAPIVVVVVLCVARADVRITMASSLACALMVCVAVQGVAPRELVGILMDGYRCADPSVAYITDGGGIASMAQLSAIVAVASTYSGLFEGTGLLRGLGDAVSDLAHRTTPFVGVLLTSVITAAIACDQVVAIMLVNQLCDGCERSHRALALDLEASVTLMPALVPWSTSCVGIAAFTGMTAGSVLYAFYPLLVPLWLLGVSLWQQAHPAFVEGHAARVMGLTEEDDARRLPYGVRA